MNCDDFDRLLGALLDGTCEPSEWRQAQPHVTTCARCRRLHDALSGRADTLDEAAHEALTASIVARTSGGTCAAARDRLCEHVDGALAGFDRDLVEGHLTRCPECAALAGALVRSARVLPTLAEVAPPAWFEQRVLAVTSRRQAEPSPFERLLAWLSRAAARPRFSVEVAYVATLVLMLVLGDPVKAVRSTAEFGASYVAPRTEAIVLRVAERVETARRFGAETVAGAAGVTAKPVSASAAWEASVGAVRRWFAESLTTPVQALLARMFEWVQGALAAVRDLVDGIFPADGEPSVPAARPDSRGARSTEPCGPAVRLT